MNAPRAARIRRTKGTPIDPVKQLNLGMPLPPAPFIPEENFFLGGWAVQVLGTADRFAPQTGYAGDKLRRYLKFRVQPGRKLSQEAATVAGLPPPLYGIRSAINSRAFVRIALSSLSLLEKSSEKCSFWTKISG